MSIVWLKNGTLIKKCGVPEKMTGKSLYFVLRNYYRNDEVEMYFQ
jgi:hypothetical protein